MTRAYWARYLFGDRRGKLSSRGLTLAREEYLAAVERELRPASAPDGQPRTRPSPPRE